MKVAVVAFPGSNCDHDAIHVLGSVLGHEVFEVWHKSPTLPTDTDAVVLPGGFSYGDYLRCGAIARFSPIMKDVIRHAGSGGPTIGICNGFQVLCEAGLLPGALLRNADLKFHCHDVDLRVETNRTAWTRGIDQGAVLRMPIAHGDGNYFVSSEELEELESNEQVVFRYVTDSGEIDRSANPNGSVAAIAGVCNEAGNVVGLMPHPERLAEAVLGGEDGLAVFRSLEQAGAKP